jgi:predicted amidophosphoribosyltransferase
MGKVKAKMSDALLFVMRQNLRYLLGQKGKPPHGKCIDCKKDIPTQEFYARCPRCEQSMVCVRCVDKHDHMHNLIELPRMIV